jgi:hypothetical protein
MQVSVNDIICIEGEISEQRSGAWIARVELDSEDDTLTGQVTLKVGTASFSGTVVRGDVPEGQGRWKGHIVGGAGGLDDELGAKNYHRTTLRSVATDALNEAGESLDSAGSDTAALSKLQAHWSRPKARARLALSEVAKKIGGFWRVTRAGKVILRKAETWQTVKFDFDYIDADPSDGTLEIAPLDTPGARPGTTFASYKVAAVRTIWSGAGVRQRIFLSDKDEQAQGNGELLSQHIRKTTESVVNYSQWYRSKIISQAADGTVDLMPDDERVRGAGLSHVPILHGIPGLTVKVVPGTYVDLFFENGDPSSPKCALAADGSSVQSVQLEAVREIVHVAPAHKFGPTANPNQSVPCGEFLMAYLDAITNGLTQALLLITAGPTTTGGAPAVASLQATLAAAAGIKQQILSQFVKIQ